MKTVAILTVLVGLVASCYSAVEFSEGPRNFSIELLHYTAKETGGHVVISPFGIWTLMTGVALGATRNSYEQLRKAFILPKNEKTLIKGYVNLTNTVLAKRTPEVTLSSQNFLFLDKNFEIYPQFRDVIQGQFGAVIKSIDFKNTTAAAITANGYIQPSGGRVSNVLTSDDFTESRMILTNVISFKGLWGSPFNETDTTLENFYDEDRNVIGKVNMMYQRAQLPFSNVKALKAFVLELPYGKDGRYSMLIVLPHPRVRLLEVYSKFSQIGLKEIFQKLADDIDKFGLEDIDVRIPRLKISTNVVLNKPLNNMGVYEVFEPTAASFDRVSKEPLYVSAIVHKADIEITESGTVASASTTADFADRISTPSFMADRPFIYFVIEKTTTTVIFSGIYSQPAVF